MDRYNSYTVTDVKAAKRFNAALTPGDNFLRGDHGRHIPALP
jgi:hypothetical protein